MKRHANCMEIREDFSALLDDELTLEERELVEGHLSECAECLRELDALKRVDVAYSALSRMKAPEGLEEGVRQGIISSLPMKPLCRTDCRGICPQCGASDNEQPCECEDVRGPGALGSLAAFLPQRLNVS